MKSAMAHYMLAGFPLGRSSFSNPISNRARREFAAQGMKLWDKYFRMPMAEANTYFCSHQYDTRG